MMTVDHKFLEGSIPKSEVLLTPDEVRAEIMRLIPEYEGLSPQGLREEYHALVRALHKEFRDHERQVVNIRLEAIRQILRVNETSVSPSTLHDIPTLDPALEEEYPMFGTTRREMRDKKLVERAKKARLATPRVASGTVVTPMPFGGQEEVESDTEDVVHDQAAK